jgi:hypothetical protein
MPVPGECTHYSTETGPRVPLRYGSAPTQVCRLCGSWRTVHHVMGLWRPAHTLAEALKEDEET